MKIKQKKGISLIVLVITIIVMIILAAAIILSLQSSGIIGRANEAKTETDAANYKELITIAHAEWMLMDLETQEENGGSFVAYAENKLEESGMDPNNYIIEETGEAKLCVAKIGDTKYASLQDAVDTAARNTNTEIDVVNNVKLETTVNIGGAKIITLDLNGFTISSVGNAISNNGFLLVMDSSANKTGRIKAVANTQEYDATYDINGNGIVGEDELDVILANYNIAVDETTSEEVKKYDLDNDGYINLVDLGIMLDAYNAGYAICNKKNLVIEEISKDKFYGEPEAIHNRGGTVEGYNFE